MPDSMISASDTAIGTIMARLDASDRSLTELHSCMREAINRIDGLTLRSDDYKGRMLLLEGEHRTCQTKQTEVTQRVEMLESKLDDLRVNLKKVIEGQIDILNSNATTREQFSAVLATKDSQHSKRMRTMRTLIYVGGGLILLATQVYARWDGHNTLVDMLIKLIIGSPG